ncbi:antirestriction protein [Agrobacterium tumefaciens]|uniref:antirestriction protein n=1 Tax=Agrobacterium tumefaciens TaxID=358 RepID=UPI002243926E|nr:antirestriction protein [Agrobacterium tumefaciens]MCW8060832.1 antirestriction protein [Agrobacterium tumefaciens]
MTLETTTSDVATIVPEDRREMFLPKPFGLPLLIVAENAIYTFMERLSPRDYGGGFWDFYERAGRPLFLAPTSRPRFRIESDITDYRGEVSAEAAGIIATLFTFSHLSFRYESDLLAEGYNRLHAYLDGHPEASAIFQAID